MKTTLYVLLLSIFMILSCNDQKPAVSEPSAAEIARVQALGEPVALKLMDTLKAALTNAMQDGGVENAIEVCNLKALPLTATLLEQEGSIMQVKRTSFKFRNPANEPDSLEELALRFFETKLQQMQDLPASYIQKIETGSGTSFRYYKPMKTSGLCLTCHGDSRSVAEPVKALLAKYYPTDKAIGYQAGDFRGLIRVSIK